MVNKAAEEVRELFDLMCPYANGYIGSSMLTNTEFPDVIVQNTRRIVMEVLTYNLRLNLYTEGWFKELVEALETVVIEKHEEI